LENKCVTINSIRFVYGGLPVGETSLRVVKAILTAWPRLGDKHMETC